MRDPPLLPDCHCEHGSVPQPGLDDHTAGITDRLRFLLRRPAGPVNGFALDDFSTIDVDGHEPSLWDEPRFTVGVLGLKRASVAEIVLRARATFGAGSTADVLAAGTGAAHARAGDHADAERELRAGLSCGDLRAHLSLAGCLCAQGRCAEAYDHARIYTELAPHDSWGFAWLGRAALELGDRAEALTALRRAVRLERAGSHRTPAARVLRALRKAA